LKDKVNILTSIDNNDVILTIDELVEDDYSEILRMNALNNIFFIYFYYNNVSK